MVPMTQRWRKRHPSFIVPREVFDPTRFEVGEAEHEGAKGFVCEHHYSGSYPAAQVRVGLYERLGMRDVLAGVAVFSVPTHEGIIPKWCALQGGGALGSREGTLLGRFVLLDHVAFNAETWFLARAIRLLRRLRPELRVVLSYSDPVRRRDEAGNVVFPGHIGQIYQASNADYLGRASKKTLHIMPSGCELSGRSLSKVRGEERGFEGVLRMLTQHGCSPRAPWESTCSYVSRLLESQELRKLRHPGNHLYRFQVDRSVRLEPAPGLKRPRQQDLEQLELFAS